jgi:hypothetical protein
MVKRLRGLTPLRDPATSSLPALVGIYTFCLYLILFLPLILRKAPEAYLMPMVFGKSLHFWISTCNVLWMIYCVVHLGSLLQSGWRTHKVNIAVALAAIGGLFLMESGMSLLFSSLTILSQAQ